MHRGFDIVPLRTRDLPAAAALLASGMRDNPLHLAVFGGDSGRRERRLVRLFGALLPLVHSKGLLLGVRVDGALAGVLGMMPPGACRPSWSEKLRFAMRFAPDFQLRGTWRAWRWLRRWERSDPDEPHWHLGPLTVRTDHRRRGIARHLMMHACDLMDAQGQAAWLETDLAQNVDFYASLGFNVMHTEPVLGVSNWFMMRHAQTSQSGFE